MKKKVMIFSGFLGSGKTTTMVNTAQYLKEKGLKVAIITNDLGSNLVDTNYVHEEKVPVSEIPNGCFCHDVPDFTSKINKLYNEENPDIIFAEPVGSCVDIVKNVYYDIADNYQDLELAPFTSIIDPVRYQAIYMNKGENTFMPQITYMYKKQLEEADVLLLNKIDTLTSEEIKEIESSIKENFPEKTVVPISAKDRTNFDKWTDTFMNGQNSAMTDLDIDWDYVCQAENMMAWYNKHLTLESTDKYDYNIFASKLMNNLKKIMDGKIEVAHLKIMLNSGREYCKSALVGSKREITFSEKFNENYDKVDAIINCRAQTTPDILEQRINEALDKTILETGLKIINQQTQAFDSFAHAPEPVIG